MVIRFGKKNKWSFEMSFEMKFRRGYNARKIEADLKKEEHYKQKKSEKEKKTKEEIAEHNFEMLLDNIDNFSQNNMIFKKYEN